MGKRKSRPDVFTESLHHDESYRFLLENSGDILWTIDLEGRWQYMTSNVFNIIHIRASDIVGKTIWDFLAPECHDVVRDKLRRRIRGEHIPAYEVLVIDRDGHRVPFEILTTPIYDKKGNVIGVQGISRDITRRKHMEEELRRSRDELESRVAERTRELQQSNHRLKNEIVERKLAEEALKAAKEQAELYLDLMGHDINNMHQIALGYLEIAERMTPPGDGRREFLEKPIEVLQRSARLIQNVRKLQKLKEGVFQSQDVDVCQTLVDVQREFGAVPHKAITLDLNGCARCHVMANELLHDVFANLVSNAIKHTGDKADINVSLRIEDDDGSSHCRVVVEDDGPGIPDDLKVRIFDRGLMSTEKAKGMGLGLYLVKSLVDSYGGRVWVEDRVEGDHTKGARFVVRLPIVQ